MDTLRSPIVARVILPAALSLVFIVAGLTGCANRPPAWAQGSAGEAPIHNADGSLTITAKDIIAAEVSKQNAAASAASMAASIPVPIVAQIGQVVAGFVQAENAKTLAAIQAVSADQQNQPTQRDLWLAIVGGSIAGGAGTAGLGTLARKKNGNGSHPP